MNNYTVSGRIMSSRMFTFDKNGTESNGLSIKVSVNTGQRAKEGEYPPSIIIDATVWDKLATVLEPRAVKGAQIVVSGQLAAPTIYTSNDGEKSGVNMAFHMVQEINILNSPVPESEGDAPEVQETAATSTKSKKAAKPVEEEDDIPF